MTTHVLFLLLVFLHCHIGQNCFALMKQRGRIKLIHVLHGNIKQFTSFYQCPTTRCQSIANKAAQLFHLIFDLLCFCVVQSCYELVQQRSWNKLTHALHGNICLRAHNRGPANTFFANDIQLADVTVLVETHLTDNNIRDLSRIHQQAYAFDF